MSRLILLATLMVFSFNGHARSGCGPGPDGCSWLSKLLVAGLFVFFIYGFICRTYDWWLRKKDERKKQKSAKYKRLR